MLYEILKTSKLGASFAPDMYTALWAQKLARDGEIKTLSGIPPLTFPSNGQPLLDYLISGNTVQSGTPTPDNPVMPEGTGERTGNLLQNVLSSTEINGVTVTVNTDKSITVNGSLTVGGNTYVTVGTVAFESGEKYTIDGVSGYLPSTLQLFTQSSSAFAIGNRLQSYNGYVTRTAAASETCDIRLYFYPNVIYDNVTVYPQIVKGDAKPYEPYGYKIPISSARQTNNIYLGEVPTTREIKKLVLTGEETWTQPYSLKVYRIDVLDYLYEMVNIPICTHYEGVAPVSGTSDLEDLETAFLISTSGNNYYYIRDDRFNNANDFKSYLQQQYANGTPVCVWYILATPETTVVNEPLQKIGDYADTLSMEQAGVEIPTARGTNTLDVLTDVKPSEIYIKYKS